MNIYEEKPWWLFVSVGLLVIFAGIVMFWPKCPIDVSFDSSTLERGSNHVMWVSVKNFLPYTARNVTIIVFPRTDGITVDKNVVVIDEMYPGDLRVAAIPLFVKSDALPGTHTIEVFVAFPGKTWKKAVRVMVQ